MNTEYGVNSIIALAAAIREQANTLILDSLAQHGVTDLLPAHGAVLNALFQQNALPMSLLAKAIGKKKNTVTSLINTLEDRGYCRRQADPQDARVQLIVLTDKGEALRGLQSKISNKILQRTWSGIGESEKLSCVQTLHLVLRNLHQYEIA